LTKVVGRGFSRADSPTGRRPLDRHLHGDRLAFAHEAGIHQDGVLKDRRTYEIMRAEDVGAPWNPLVLGKHSGRHAVQRRCADLGFTLEGEALVDVYRALMAVADDRKTISDDDIREVVAAVRARRATVPVTH